MSGWANFKNHEHVLDLTEIRHKKGVNHNFPIEMWKYVQKSQGAQRIHEIAFLKSKGQLCLFYFDLKQLFRSSHFSFLVTFGDEVTKIWKYYLIFVYILQGKMGKMEKNWKENHATEVTEIPKDKNTGWTKQKTPRMTGCTIRIFNHQSLKSYQLRLF